MHYNSLIELPLESVCKVCLLSKPVAEMIVIFSRAGKKYYLRPRCKECHNQKERNHRREWKRNYLKKWRKNNVQTTKSYYDNDIAREKAKHNAARRYKKNQSALLVQKRLKNHGLKVSIEEAKDLVNKYGWCYPLPSGLTVRGKKEVERIRSTFRRRKKKYNLFEIRMMVYEDDCEKYYFVIEPSKQPSPFHSTPDQPRKAKYRIEKNGTKFKIVKIRHKKSDIKDGDENYEGKLSEKHGIFTGFESNRSQSQPCYL